MFTTAAFNHQPTAGIIWHLEDILRNQESESLYMYTVLPCFLFLTTKYYYMFGKISFCYIKACLCFC